MVRVVEGTYRSGKVELTEIPPGVEGSGVVVVFLEPDSTDGAAVAPPADPTRAAEDVLAMMRSSNARLGGKPYTDRGEIYDRDGGR